MKLSTPLAMQLITRKLSEELSVAPDRATDEQFYRAAALVVKEILADKQRRRSVRATAHGEKRIHYLSMEFLPGRSLRNALFNLGILEEMSQALSQLGTDLERLYNLEPDAGLGNGGLGRLAACYLDGLATDGFCAAGYSILYEYGIFQQKIIDGWQTELPDYWIPGGEVWLTPHPDQSIEVRFGGEVEEWWENGRHRIRQAGYSTVTAVPYDLFISGYDTDSVSVLRLFKAKSPGVNMDLFNKGDYLGAFGEHSVAETISKVLYPNDSHQEGKRLRLRQQYFLSAAAVGDIVRRHLTAYGSLDSFAEKNAIQINDTHPVLAIPEMMRVLLDDFGYRWDAAWDVVTRVFSYTNHTVMKEALEVWSEDLLSSLLPRIWQIIREINERFCRDLAEKHGCGFEAVSRMAVTAYHEVRMANLAVAACHTVNGVSGLHSKLVTTDVFPDYFRIAPYKFTNVTNGIASRRWLCQANPGLTGLLLDTIGDGFLKDFSELSKFRAFAGDPAVLERVAAVKRENKIRLAGWLAQNGGERFSPDTLVDIQVKRLHEYKRQQMNALNIIADIQAIRDNPGAGFFPKTYLFGAKAAPGYYLAKQIIKLICALGALTRNDPVLKDKLRVLFFEDYRVTLSELMMPASDLSEQISLAGTEASGTGNMKLMLGGAVTIGTWDGANIEIAGAVGEENILIFGLRAEEVQKLRAEGYDPAAFPGRDPVLSRALGALVSGELGETFPELHDALLYTDRYLALADFASYRETQRRASELYRDAGRWRRMSLWNTASSGMFCADRAVMDYAKNIWGLVNRA